MVDIPKCKERHARLPISIEPNAPGPGSYTIHFGGEGGTFNAAHIANLPLELNRIKNLAEESFFGICQEKGDLYVESTVGIEAQPYLTPSSHVVNLARMFKEAESSPMRVSIYSAIPMHSIVPGELESQGITLHKKGKFKEAQEAFDKAILNGELTTAVGMYYAGFNALMRLEFDLFDSPTFQRIVMLWGAATAFSKSVPDNFTLGSEEEDDPFNWLVRDGKGRALSKLEELGQIRDPELKEYLSKLNSSSWFRDHVLDIMFHPELSPGHVRERMARLEGNLKEDPGDIDILTELARIYKDAGRFGEAIEFLKELVESSVEGSDYYWSYMKKLVSAYRDAREAGQLSLEEYIQVLERFDPDSEEMAELYIEKSDFAKAIYTAERLVSLDQEQVERFERAVNKAKLDPKHMKKFEKDLREARFKLTRHLHDLATIYILDYGSNPQADGAKDCLRKAAEAYTRLLEIKPDDYDALRDYAWVQFKLGFYEEAIRLFSQLETEGELKRADFQTISALLHEYDSRSRNQEVDTDIKDAIRRLSEMRSLYEVFSVVRDDAMLPADALQALRDATTADPQNIKAWQKLGLTLYGITAQEEPLEALTKALDLLAENPDVELKAVGKLSDNARVELLAAQLTVAIERKQFDTALHYLTTHADFLEQMEMKLELPQAILDKGISKYEREFEALDTLLYLRVVDPRLEQLANVLKWALLSGLETKTDANKPVGSNSDGTPGAPTGAAPKTDSSPSAPQAPDQRTAPKGSIPIAVGGFHNNEEVPFIPSTSSTESAELFYNYETGTWDPGAADMDTVLDPVDFAYDPSFQGWTEFTSTSTAFAP